MKKETKATIKLRLLEERYLRWYGKNDRPKEISVEIDEKGYKSCVDIAFGKENQTKNHLTVVESWEELETLTFADSKRKNGFRIVDVYEIITSRPIIYHKQN